MKYLKLLALFLLPLSFTACSDDDEPVNTGSATVEFAQSAMEVRESTNIVRIPIKVSGEHNGDIFVTAKMSGNNANLSEENLIVTTENFTMPVEVETVYLECHLVGVANEGIESGRNITFEITNATGASVGANKTCTVNLKENNPLEGTYTLSGYAPFDGAIGSEKVSLTMEDGVTDKAYIDCGWGGLLQINLEEVIPGVKYNITIPGAQAVGTYSSYGNVLFVYGGVNWNTGQVSAGANDITGVFESGVITLDAPLDYGVGYYIPGAGWLGLYVAYENEAGAVVPVTLKK